MVSGVEPVSVRMAYSCRPSQATPDHCNYRSLMSLKPQSVVRYEPLDWNSLGPTLVQHC